MQNIFEDKRYYHGILRLEKGERGMVPCRFTETQLDLYRVNAARLIRAMCPAGVSIQMQTDAKWLQLDMYVTGMARKRAQLAAIVDGERRPVVSCPMGEEGGPISARFELDGEEHQVEIYLPCLVSLEVTGLSFPEETAVMCPVEPKEQMYLAIGDSITQGMEANDPTRIVSTQVARTLDMEQLNLGVGGGTYIPALIENVGIAPSLITVAYGTNDRMMVDTEEQFRSNVEGLLSNLEKQYPGVRCVVITPPYDERPGGKFTTDTECVRRIVREITARHPKFELIEGMALVPRGKDYFADGVHPNDLGFQLYSSSLLKRLMRG